MKREMTVNGAESAENTAIHNASENNLNYICFNDTEELLAHISRNT